MDRYLNPPGVVVAVLGVDGAGKSTVIKSVLPVLTAATHGAVFIRHLRPYLFPPLSYLKGRKNVPAGRVVEPHNARASGILGSWLRLGYLTLDYVFGYWLITRPKIAREPAIVLYDRYAYDMVLDPRRFRIGVSARVAGWFVALAPKPDLIFCLSGDPEAITSRKRELSLSETSRQIHALQAFAQSEPRAVLVAADTPVEWTRYEVLEALYTLFENRMIARDEQVRNGV